MRFLNLCKPLILGAAILLAAQTPAVQAETTNGYRTKIVGGSPASARQWPGLAALRHAAHDGRVASYFCGGTAIAERWVLTAAHCLPPYVQGLEGPLRDAQGALHPGRLEVVIGADDLRKVTQGQVFVVDRVVIHDNYLAQIKKAASIANKKQRERFIERIAIDYGDDIALLRLSRPWTGPVTPLSLSGDSDPQVPPGAQVRVAGFGSTEPDPKKRGLKYFQRSDGAGEFFAPTAELLEASIEAVETEKCRDQYKTGVIGDGQFCAGLEQGGKDSCAGDSGGPLVAEDANQTRQIGVVSWGLNFCGASPAYGIYTRVSQHADWIQSHTGPLRGAPLLVQAAGLSPTQLNAALTQLQAVLGPAEGRVRIGMRGGNRVPLGAKVVFEAQTDTPGRLIILDIDSDRKVTLIYPNEYVAQEDIGRIAAGDVVAVPGPGYPGFTAFEAREPIGKGFLIALVAPEDFDIERFAASRSLRIKGMVPVNDPPNYLMRLIRQIEVALGLNVKAGHVIDDELKRWGYAVKEYEITD